jgi:hypothetical protein
MHLGPLVTISISIAYRRFVGAGNDPWKVSSTYLNARTIAATLGKRDLARELGQIFGDPDPVNAVAETEARDLHPWVLEPGGGRDGHLLSMTQHRAPASRVNCAFDRLSNNSTAFNVRDLEFWQPGSLRCRNGGSGDPRCGRLNGGAAHRSSRNRRDGHV